MNFHYFSAEISSFLERNFHYFPRCFCFAISLSHTPKKNNINVPFVLLSTDKTADEQKKNGEEPTEKNYVLFIFPYFFSSFNFCLRVFPGLFRVHNFQHENTLILFV